MALLRALCWTGLALLAGCSEVPSVCDGDACLPVQVTNDRYSYGLNNKADILFVVDGSVGGPLAGALRDYLPRFMAPLEHLPPPADLRVGVTTTDLAAGGEFVQARFLSIDQCWEGYETKSFEGTLGEAFGEYAAVPATGTARVQPLAALRAALEGDAGFLRRDAYLLVVVIAGQDDCSGTTDIGALTPYGCYQHDAELTPVEQVAAALKAVKPADPRMVHVSVIAGPPEPVVVGTDGGGSPALEPSCTGGMAQGTPAIRLARFLGQFDDDRVSFLSICASELSDAVADAVQGGGEMLAQQCLSAPLLDQEPGVEGVQPELVVEECHPTQDPACDECQSMPACSATAPDRSRACWYLLADEDACPAVDPSAPVEDQHRVYSGYRFKVDWGGTATCSEHVPSPGTVIRLQYVSCGAEPSAGYFDCSPGCAAYWPRCCPTPTAGCFP